MSVDTARSSGHRLQLGALCPFTPVLSLLVDLIENRNLLFPSLAVLSLYATQKNAFKKKKKRAYVDTEGFFFCAERAYMITGLLHEQSDHCAIRT